MRVTLILHNMRIGFSNLRNDTLLMYMTPLWCTVCMLFSDYTLYYKSDLLSLFYLLCGVILNFSTFRPPLLTPLSQIHPYHLHSCLLHTLWQSSSATACNGEPFAREAACEHQLGTDGKPGCSSNTASCSHAMKKLMVDRTWALLNLSPRWWLRQVFADGRHSSWSCL